MQVAYITAPRHLSYIEKSIQSLEDQACFGRVGILAEPNTRVLAGHWMNYSPVKLGSVLNRARAITVAEITCEDDVLWLPGSGKEFLKQIERTPDVFVSAYTAQPCANKEERGWHPNTFKHFCGALALYVPPKHRFGVTDRLLKKKTHYGVDLYIGGYAQEHNVDILVHTPSLCDHLGEVGTRPAETVYTEEQLFNRQPYLE